MSNFPYQLVPVEDAETEDTHIGFLHEASGCLIHDPSVSECGRFPGDVSYYGLTDGEAYFLRRLNRLIKSATEDALNAACYHIQSDLGITKGDAAGVFFSGPQEFFTPFERRLAEYICYEVNCGDLK